MCLKTLMTTKEKKEHKTKEWGWKVYEKKYGERGIFPCCQGNGERIPTGKWLNEKDFAKYPNLDVLRTGGGGFEYLRGVHIWLQKPAQVASYHSLRKVWFKKPVAWGFDQNKPTVVVERFWVSPKAETKPITKGRRFW